MGLAIANAMAHFSESAERPPLAARNQLEALLGAQTICVRGDLGAFGFQRFQPLAYALGACALEDVPAFRAQGPLVLTAVERCEVIGHRFDASDDRTELLTQLPGRDPSDSLVACGEPGLFALAGVLG